MPDPTLFSQLGVVQSAVSPIVQVRRPSPGEVGHAADKGRSQAMTSGLLLAASP